VRIVDVCAFYAPAGGGVRTYVEQKLREGPRLGHEIVILAPGPEDRTEVRAEGARIEWLKSPRLPVDFRYRYFDNEARLQERLARERPDFVEVSSPWRSAIHVGRWPGAAPRALFMHADPLAAYGYRWLGRFASVETIDRRLERAWRYFRRLSTAYDVVVTPSVGLAGRLSAQGIANATAIPLGVEAGLFSPALRDEALRTRLLARCNLPADATLLLGVGRHSPEKRWPLVIAAVAAAAIERPIGLVLVGDGRERARIVRQVHGNPHIHLVSPLDDRAELARLMASADAFIHGCDAETFSFVVAEAAASGLPLIVPDRGGTADHARVNRGFTYTAGDAADAGRAILACIDAGRQRLPGRPARTLNDHFAELFSFYAGMAAEARRAA
jgi:alpha-1,6-mannosyltransferase